MERIAWNGVNREWCAGAASTSTAAAASTWMHQLMQHAPHLAHVATPHADNPPPALTSLVYVAQGELAIADPSHVHWIGSSDATTCMVVIVHLFPSRHALCAHLDDPERLDSFADALVRACTRYHTTHCAVHANGSYAIDPTRPSWAALPSALLRRLLDTLPTTIPFTIATWCVGPWNTREQVGPPEWASALPPQQPVEQSPLTPPVSFFPSPPIAYPLPRTIGLYLHLPSHRVVSNLTLHIPLSARGPLLFERNAAASATDDKRLLECYHTDDDTYEYPRVASFGERELLRYSRRLVETVLRGTPAQLLRDYSTSPFAEPPHFCSDMRETMRVRVGGSKRNEQRAFVWRRQHENAWERVKKGVAQAHASSSPS